MKFYIWYFNHTALDIAIGKENVEIVKLLLKRKDININIKSISHIID